MTTKGTAVTKRPRPAAVRIPHSCSRCHRRLDSRARTASMALLEDGYVEGVACVECLSLEEMARCAILEATTEAALKIRDGRILVRTKQFPTE